MEEVSDNTLDVLELRIKQLENKTFGKDEIPSLHETAECDRSYQNVISVLASLGSKLGNALSTRDRMMMVMKRLDELERYLDPTYGESDLSDNVKTDLILAQEDHLHTQYQHLNTLTTLKQCLDSQSIADTLNLLNTDLIKLWHTYGETEQLGQEQSENITEVIENYNSIIMTLTETFIRMDDIVTKAELASIPKKVSD